MYTIIMFYVAYGFAFIYFSITVTYIFISNIDKKIFFLFFYRLEEKQHEEEDFPFLITWNLLLLLL